jgi:hypothetical protein
MPPMKIRIGKDINEKLGKRAVIDGYVEIPIFTYLEHSIKDDVTATGCEYVSEVSSYFAHNPDTFDDILPSFKNAL